MVLQFFTGSIRHFSLLDEGLTTDIPALVRTAAAMMIGMATRVLVPEDATQWLWFVFGLLVQSKRPTPASSRNTIDKIQWNGT